MLKDIPAIRPATFEAMVSPWLAGLANRDIVAVISYPASDRTRRTLNLLDDQELLAKYLHRPKAYIFFTIDFRVDPVSTPDDLEYFIYRKLMEKTGWKPNPERNFQTNIEAFGRKCHQKPVMFAIGAEKLIEAQKASYLIWFTTQCRIDLIRMVLFFETNLFAPQTIKFLSTFHVFQPRIHFMKLYEHPDSLQFIKRMCESEWRVSITDEMKEIIANECGGCFLLIKEALWYLRDHPGAKPEELFGHTEMLFNLDILWNGFSPDEQTVFTKLVKREPIDPPPFQSTLRYLLATGYLSRSNNTYRITVPLFERYIKSVILAVKPLSLDSRGRILIENIPIDSHFSKTERKIVSLLLSTPDELVTRDAVGTILSNDDEPFSDWALDSHISRLRSKFVRLGLPKEILETRKRRGVILHTAPKPL